MADTRPATERHPNWAARRENRTSATQRHHGRVRPLAWATSAFPSPPPYLECVHIKNYL